MRHPSTQTTGRRAGSWTGSVSGILTGTTFVAGIVGGAKLASTRIPMPGAPADEVRNYYSTNPTAVRVSITGQTASILTLIGFTREVAGLAAGSGRGSRILGAAVWAAGLGSAACLAVSAATATQLTTEPDVDDETILRRARRVFVAGGPVHAVPYGVFVAALGSAGLRAGLWHRPAAGIAAASAASSLLSPAYFRWENAGWLIPIGRFTGYLLSAVAGARLLGRCEEDSR